MPVQGNPRSKTSRSHGGNDHATATLTHAVAVHNAMTLASIGGSPRAWFVLICDDVALVCDDVSFSLVCVDVCSPLFCVNVESTSRLPSL